MSEPTAGPWHAVIAPDEQPSLLYAGIVTTLHYSPDPDGYVAVVADAPLGMGEQSLLEECQANARLIAASPDLLEALLDLKWFVTSSFDDDVTWIAPLLDRVDAAIAAAAAPATAAPTTKED